MTPNQTRLYEIELETQNRELRQSRSLLEETIDLYATLYDFAAVGCLTLDARGCLREINLTAAQLLGVDRERVIGLPLARWLDPDSVPTLFAHLRKCNKSKGRVATELQVAQKAGPAIRALLITAAKPGIPGSTHHQSALIDLRGISLS